MIKFLKGQYSKHRIVPHRQQVYSIAVHQCVRAEDLFREMRRYRISVTRRVIGNPFL